MKKVGIPGGRGVAGVIPIELGLTDVAWTLIFTIRGGK